MIFLVLKDLQVRGMHLLKLCRTFSPTSRELTRRVAALHTSTSESVEAKPLKFLTAAERKQYHDDGYIVVKDILSADEVEECRQALEEIKLSCGTDDSDIEKGIDGSIERVRYPSRKHDVFLRLIHNSKLLDCVEDLFGTDSIRYIPQDKLNCKPAGGGAAIPWHQDWAHFPHTNDSVLTACLLLENTTRENGCLQVVPGSHKGPLFNHAIDGNFTGIITEPYYKPEKRVHLEATAGSVTFHHVRAVHGSAQNNSTFPRGTVCNIFTAMDAWPLLGVPPVDVPSWFNHAPVDYDQFVKSMVRGKPCSHPRMETNPVSLPIPFVTEYSVITEYEFIIPPEP